MAADSSDTMRRRIVLLLICLAISNLSACVPATTSIDPLAYKATSLKGDPVITFNVTADKLMIDITTLTGIGSSAIEKITGQWPPQIVLRLRVQGLESLKFHYADMTIDVSVSSNGDHVVREEASATGTLRPDDPNWMAVTPSEDYFEVTTPAAFLKSGENKFTIEWIDFYR